MMMRLLIFLAAHAAAACAFGQGHQFDLSNYRLTRTHELFVPEASSIAYNPDRGTLFVIDDGAGMIVECDHFGTGISMVLLSGFEDTEGIGYIGNGQFVVVEERIQRVSLLTWPVNPTPTVTIAQSSLPSVTLGPNVGNSGLEGICFDPVTGGFLIVKEKSPQKVFNVAIDFTVPSASVAEQCPVAGLGVADLADIAVLSSVARLANAPDRDNLLIISQASPRILEVNRAGVVQSEFDLLEISESAEGVTIDEHGVIYVAAEGSHLYVLEPCHANFDGANGVTIDDLFLYINAYFQGLPSADFNGVGGVTIDDLFLYINAYFGTCS